MSSNRIKIDLSTIPDRNHQFALNSEGEWVNAEQTTYMENQTFFCECPNKHKMKLVKPSGICGKRPFCDYFAHVQYSSKKQKTDEPKFSCIPSSESLEHRTAKQRLREMVGFYFFSTFRCRKCSLETIVDTVGCSVSIEVVSDDKRWRYDCLLKRGALAVAALEVFHTHLTGSEKTQSVRSSGLEIAEFRSLDVLNISKECRTKLDNLKMQVGLCENCLIQASFTWARHCLYDEWIEVRRQEWGVGRNYMLHEKLMKERKLKLLQASYQWAMDCLYDEWIEVNRQEKAVVINYTLHEQIVRERELKLQNRLEVLLEKSKTWIMECFFDEMEEIQYQESVKENCYLRQHEMRAVLQITDRHKMCQALICVSLSKIKINVPCFGVISFTKAAEWANGVLVHGFDRQLPTKMMCIFLVGDTRTVHISQWKHPSVESAFHIFLHYGTILRSLNSLEADLVLLKDCRWPILKNMEENLGMCANCGVLGHRSSDCRVLFCMRCGRNGHIRKECFESKDVINQYLTTRTRRW